MVIVKKEPETKRVIFNIRGDLADRLLLAKEEARSMGKRLDIETTINKAIEKFLQKAEKRIKEEKKKHGAFLQALEKITADGVLSDSKDAVESVVTEENPR
jgi:vacuolar-type H+-ATPase subunit H